MRKLGFMERRAVPRDEAKEEVLKWQRELDERVRVLEAEARTLGRRPQ